MKLFDIKSILVLLLILLTSGSLAKGGERSSISVQGNEKSSHLHTVTVKRQVHIDGGLYQGESCTVRYDDKLHLLEVSESCGVLKKIHLYNADDMWLGSADGPYKSGCSYNNVYTDAVAYAKYIGIENEWGPVQEYRIKCNQRNAKPRFDGYSYSCAVPYGCPKGMYAVNAYECTYLPENTIRNSGVGYKCKPGYSDIDGSCVKPYDCGKHEYAVDEENCRTLPLNAVRKDPIGFRCKNGYYYWSESVSCEKLPLHAIADAKEGYVCADGYIYDPVNDRCILPYQCGKGEYAIDEKTCGTLPNGALRNKTTGYMCAKGCFFWPESNSCEKLPANAVADTNGGFICAEGYLYDEINDKCISPYRCGKGEYAIDETVCAKLPKGAERTKTIGYQCSKGYYKTENDSCLKLPLNAIPDQDFGFICKDGFFLEGQSCRAKYGCAKDEYAVDETSCNKLPRNAKRNEHSGFSCKKGYYLTRMDECEKLPANAIAAEIGYMCDKGFVEKDGACSKPFQCTSGEYALDSVLCEKLPRYGIRLKTVGFKCQGKYYKPAWSADCEKIPENSVINESGDDFSCMPGYIRESVSCIRDSE